MLREADGKTDNRGMTLVELLVVIVIIMMLAAVVLPMMQPIAAGRDLREAARQLNAFIAGQQGRAARLGRPAGIWMEREASNSAASVRIYGAQVPPPYSGDTFNARVTISGGTATFQSSCCGSAASLAGVGDYVKFNYKGPLYRINSPVANSFTFDVTSTDFPAPPNIGAPGVPFQIYRQPRKAAGAMLELPVSTCVDLANSGIGPGAGAPGKEFATGSDPVIILFRPHGGVDRILSQGYANATNVELLGTIHFLVGRFDQTGAANLNYSDPIVGRNLWVSIDHREGGITTAPMNINPAKSAAPPSVDNMAIARYYAELEADMGGN